MDKTKISTKITKSSNDYTAKNIDTYEGLEAIRKRPEMYIGSKGTQGLHHLVWEVIDNSVDEYLAGFCENIDVTINKDRSITVVDNGRGIPVDIHPKHQIPAVEVLLTIPHSGGKFGGSGYSVSGGLHGIGVKAVNALSTRLLAQIIRDGQMYEIEYKRGQKSKDLKVVKKGLKSTGTTITFSPDPQIFRDTIEFDRKTILDRLYESSYLNPKLRISFRDLRGESPYEKVYYSERGILELLENKTSKLKVLTKDPFQVTGYSTIDRKNPDTNEDETINTFINIVFEYTNSENDNYYSYVNNIRTKDGEHVKAFKKAVHKAFNAAARELKILKDKDKDIRDKDALSGIASIIYIRFPEPRFESQTKEILSSEEAYAIVYKGVFEEAIKYFKKNKNIVKNLVTYSQEQEKMREEMKATKEITQDTGMLFNDSLPGKLADCESEDILNNEIFIVEGDSAGGSAKDGRDRFFQAILALKGKVLNVQGQKVKKVLDNNEIQSIVAALGCGVKELCDPNKARYGKVIILTDADVDGAHIVTLLLTFFYHYMRPYVEAGRLFIAKPPLYKIEFKSNVKKYKKGEIQYFYDENSMKDAVHGLIEGTQFTLQRYKGLGEMNPEQLWETTMDPSVRRLDQVILPDAMKAESQFETFMGGNSEDKVDFIKKVIKAYKLKKEQVSNINDLEELAELDLSDDEISKEIEKDLSKFENISDKNTALRAMTEVLKTSIGDYAYYVNIKRNIPDIRDGLKPVQRRIAWSMYDEGVTKNKPYKKAARIVGDVMGKYHPHGDSAIYEALVKLSQYFHENVPIFDFHGNVGNIDGDPAAAYRYTETRLNDGAEDMLEFIDRDTVDFQDNFDYQLKEPVCLPGKFPYILINGTQGVGVSVSTNIPAHNVSEVLNAIKYVIDNPNCTVKDIMKFIKGPDFVTGGLLIDSGLREAYETGNGTYKVRAKIETEIIKGRQALVVTEIPYNVMKKNIVQKVSEVCRDRKDKNGKIIEKKISDVEEYKDQTTKKEGMRLVFFLKKTANAEDVKKQLYQFTPLETSYKINLLAIDNEEIKIFNLKEMIESYIQHRQIVLTRKYNYDLKKKEERKHLVEGFLKILRPESNLDKAIELIKKSKGTQKAKESLIKTFDLTETQAQYILDRRLATINQDDVKKYQDELKELKQDISAIKKVLSDINEINSVIKQDLEEMLTKYSIPRKTQIVKADKVEKMDQKSLEVKNVEDIFVGLDVKNKLKKVKIDADKKIINFAPKDTPMVYIEKTNTSQKVLGLTSANFIVQANLNVLPYSTDKNKNGVSYDLKKELQASGRLEKVKVNYSGKKYVLLLFETGEIEKMPISYFQSSEYKYEVKLLDFIFADNDDLFFVTTRNGQMIVTDVGQFREAQRQKVILLDKKDKILNIDYYNENGYLLIVTENSFTNLVSLKEFSPQGKGGKGIRYYKQGAKTGLPTLSVYVNSDKQHVYLTTDQDCKTVTITMIAEVNNRNVIGKQYKNLIKDINPLFI